MKVIPMKADRRTAIGRNQVAQLRKDGWMPAVVYGDGGENISIAISEWELDQHVKAHHRVYELNIEGAQETALLQDVAWHTLTDRPLHADFRRIDLSKPIESDLEVSLLGHPVGLGKGGALIKDQLVIRIRCLPTAMPEALEHDISKLEVQDGVLASQLELPEGVELVSSPEQSICHVAVAKLTQTEIDAAEEGEEGAESPEGSEDGETPPSESGS